MILPRAWRIRFGGRKLAENSLDVLANDTDPDAGATLTIVGVDSQTAGASVTVDARGGRFFTRRRPTSPAPIRFLTPSAMALDREVDVTVCGVAR